ncbi:MAG: hypothetical protein ACLRSD_05705 [Oscillibacter sp.]
MEIIDEEAENSRRAPQRKRRELLIACHQMASTVKNRPTGTVTLPAKPSMPSVMLDGR